MKNYLIKEENFEITNNNAKKPEQYQLLDGIMTVCQFFNSSKHYINYYKTKFNQF